MPDTTPARSLAAMRAELAALWHTTVAVPQPFPDPAVEAAFQRVFREQGLPIARMGVGLATALAFIVAAVVWQDPQYDVGRVRFTIDALLGCMFATVFVLLVRAPQFVVRHWSRLMGTACMITVLSTATLWISKVDTNPISWLQAPAVIIYISMAIATFVRLSVRACATITVAGNAAYLAGMAWHGVLSAPLSPYLVLSAVTATVLAAGIERRERRVFAVLRDRERLAASQARVLATASHDLRQPLVAMDLHLEALALAAQRGDALDTDPVRSALAQLNDCTRTMRSQISRLLAAEHYAAGQKFPTQPVDVAQLFARLEAVYAAQARDAGVVLRIERPPAAAEVVHSHADRLSDMVSNLVDNAIKYAPSGGRAGRVTVRATARRDPSGQGPTVAISVVDNGCGIAPEHHARIFERGEQIGPVRRGSLGIGLTVVADNAALLPGHRIELQSAIGEGATFTLIVPAAAVADPARPAPAHAADPTRPALAGQLTVLVDDEATVLAALTATLEAWGMQVRAGADVDSARRLTAEHERLPDAIVTDWRLAGGHTGAQVIEAVRHAAGYDVPAIVVTGEPTPPAVLPADTALVRKGATIAADLEAALCEAVTRAAALRAAIADSEDPPP